MEFESVILMHKENGIFLEEGFRIYVGNCFENIKSFYEENGRIFLTLSLEVDFTDDKFDYIMENFCYEEFEKLNLEVNPKDDEYYPTFLIEFEIDIKENIQEKMNCILELFMEKVIKIYCNES